jgi:YidC/Oxa1 family membrane protein insertase
MRAGARGAVDAAPEAPRLAIETPRIEGSINLQGGRIDTLRLKGYRETVDPTSPIVQLLAPVGGPNAYYALHGWAPGGALEFADVPGPNTVWTAPDGARLTPETPVILTWDNGSGLTFTKTIAVDADYMFTVTQGVTNNTADPQRMAAYGVIARHGIPTQMNFFILHEGLVQKVDGTLTETDYDDLPDLPVNATEAARAEVVEVTENGWTGFTDHYWMTSLIPTPGTPFTAVTKFTDGAQIMQTEVRHPTLTVAPGETAEVTSRLFAGAKEWATIRGYERDLGIVKFIDSIDWGWFYFLTKPIFAVLHWLNALIGNMGWAIIGLTFVLKAILFPLAYKSYVAMARMKELQPEMEKIKERAGEDKQKLQKEMMQLYKEKKVNPAAGCLPILLQIPIFFSLYKVIFVTIELRHAPFVGWLNDLSAPDPSSLFNLFGVFPWDAPATGSVLHLIFIGLLPILLGISMWLQQKLNPAPTDPTQQMIFAWMPWIFMFMLGSFASGLVIYWIANNMITFAQQYIIMKSHGHTPDLFGNIRAAFRRKPAETAPAATPAKPPAANASAPPKGGTTKPRK